MPFRYKRDEIIEGTPYAGYDRHNGEIAAFHLDRYLYICEDFHMTTKVIWQRVSLSPKDFLIGAYLYPHWENRVSIRTEVSPNLDSIHVVDTDSVSIGAYWYPHWVNRVLIEIITCFPNQETLTHVVDIDSCEW